MNPRIIPIALCALAIGTIAVAKSPAKLITSAQQKTLLALTGIGFEGKDDRLRVKRKDLKDAVRHFNAGDLTASIAALDKADGTAPFEVVDFSSWPMRDILACRQSAPRPVSASKTFCANAFETGAATCANAKGLEPGCVQNYCEYELYTPAYENPHASYLSAKNAKAVQSALRTVQAHCGR